MPKEKPEDGAAVAPPKMPPAVAGVAEEAAAEVLGVPLPPKLNDMADEMSARSLNVGKGR